MTTSFTFTVTGMHCASCGMLIDETLEDLASVHSSQTSLRHHRTTVQADTNADVQAITAAINNLGYQARLEHL